MAYRMIKTEGDPILKKKSRTVTEFDERLWTLLDDMKTTLYKAEGVGLAAVQVGVLKRVVVIDVEDDHGFMELVNPEIIESKGVQKESEGCLSFPDKSGVTERPMYVKVKAQDRNGKFFEVDGEGLLGRCFCHEIDHLDGISFVQRLAPGERVHLSKD
ncbi:MAG: peptide deformylase [Clostridiales bacterium]|nr:peptide deformylase [Clostridiales bacterium]